MAKKEKINLADLSSEDIKLRLESERTSLQKLKFNHAVTPLENPMLIRKSRREIARLLTETNKRKAATAVK
jgi:large subunit ribosomal protein L29